MIQQRASRTPARGGKPTREAPRIERGCRKEPGRSPAQISPAASTHCPARMYGSVGGRTERRSCQREAVHCQHGVHLTRAPHPTSWRRGRYLEVPCSTASSEPPVAPTCILMCQPSKQHTGKKPGKQPLPPPSCMRTCKVGGQAERG
jgi:hypothetical protein